MCSGAVRVVRALAVCPGSCPGCPGCLRSWGGRGCPACPGCPGCLRSWGGRGCPGCPGFSCLSGLVSGLSGCRWTGLSGLSRALAFCLGSSVRAVRRVFGGGVGPSGVGPSCPVSSGRGLQSGQCGCLRSWACAGVYMGIGIC